MDPHMGEVGSDTLDQLKSNVRVLLKAWADQFTGMPIRTLNVELRGSNRGKWKITISLGSAKNTMEFDKLVKEFYDRATIAGLARATDPVLSAQQLKNMAYHYGKETFDSDDPYKEIPAMSSYSPPTARSTGADEDVAALVLDDGSGGIDLNALEFKRIMREDFSSFDRCVECSGKVAKVQITKI